ncbi:MAG: ribose-phosphate diphosphokinase [Acidimicrobiales bacterium]
MRRVLLWTAANRRLGERLSARLGAAWSSAPAVVQAFPDGELTATVPAAVRGADAYILHGGAPDPSRRLLELGLLLDAARAEGAGRLTVVAPYLAYARQDRRPGPGASLGLRTVARMITLGGADRLVVLDPHGAGVELAFDLPVIRLGALDLLANALRQDLPPDPVILAPDLGAAKLAARYAARLGAPAALVRKTRLSGESVRAEALVGEVADRSVIIVDDMISTAGTIVEAWRTAAEAGARPRVTVVAAHGLFAGAALERLAALPLAALITTDSVEPEQAPAVCRTVDLAPLLAEALTRLHQDDTLEGVAAY